MPIFEHDGHNIQYELNPASVEGDLILMHGSRFDRNLWRDVISEFELPVGENRSKASRILIVEPLAGLEADALFGFFKSLGLNRMTVVAIGDAAGLIDSIVRKDSGFFKQTLLYPKGAPSADKLVSEISELVS